MEPISEQLRRILRNQLLRFKALFYSLLLSIYLSLSLSSHGGRDTSLYSAGTKVPRRLQDRQSPPVWIRRGIMATHSEVIWKGISSLDNTAPEDPYIFSLSLSLCLLRSLDRYIIETIVAT